MFCLILHTLRRFNQIDAPLIDCISKAVKVDVLKFRADFLVVNEFYCVYCLNM